MNELETLKKYYADSTLYAKEYKEKGGKVVGYECNCVPEEFIIAAGFLPLRVNSKVGNDIALVAQKIGPGEQYAHSMAARIVAGDYAFVDYLVIPHSRNTVHKSYTAIKKILKDNPDLQVPELYLLDKAHSLYQTSQLYNRDRMIEFKSALEKWAGKEISDADLKAAAELCNQTRMLLEELEACRRDAKISGVDALAVIGASMFMDKKEYNVLLAGLLDNLKNAEVLPGKKIFFTGAPQDNTSLYELIESLGAVVVADDHCWGNRCAGNLVKDYGNITEDIIDRYNNKPLCPHNPSIFARIDQCASCMEASKADGVIFVNYKNDPQAWDIPEERKRADELGKKNIYLFKQKYPVGNPDETKAAISDFLASL